VIHPRFRAAGAERQSAPATLVRRFWAAAQLHRLVTSMHRLVFVSLAVLAYQNSHAQTESASCPRTNPFGQVLGKPFPPSESWYGSEALAVMLPPDGIWLGMGPEYHYRDKLFWWSFGFKPGVESKLKVTGRRLDGASPAASVSRTSDAYSPSLGGWAMLVAVEFPGPGCWEITGEYVGQRLSFVVEVPGK
jgi:hypothetical protein